MSDQEDRSMDRAFRPSAALPPQQAASSTRRNHPAVQAEVDRRVEIYARQVEERGRITWLPHRGSGE